MSGIRIGFAALLGLAAAAHAAALPELWQAAGVLPLLLWAPGRGWARQRHGDRWGRELAAVAWSLGALVPVTLASRFTGAGGWGILLGMGAFGVLGLLVPGPRAPARGHDRVVLLGLLLTAGAVWSERDALARPLQGYWYAAEVDAGWEPPTAVPVTGGGWRSIHPLPGGSRGWVPEEDHPFLLGPWSGPVMVLLQGPVGARAQVGDVELRVRADVVEEPGEGPVPRYLDQGVASALVTRTAQRGERIPVTLSDPAHSVLLLVPTADAVWELHGAGLLRHVHYYQLLNMVEQLRWVGELAGERWVTDVQPPLWTWVLAGPLTVTGGAHVTANVTLAALLLVLVLAGVVALRAWAPDAPGLAYLLPAGAAAVHARLLLEPGSAGLPDTLYTLGVVAAVGALARGGGFVGWGLAAQLSRYPATLLVGAAAVFAGERRRFGLLLAAVAGTAAAFGIGGAISGSLPGWIATVWWETGPEHWHGETSPAALLPRVPAFYERWLVYAGGTPILAAMRWPRGTRVALGAALLYSLLLATVDHHPSHYFLPLVHLSALAAGTTAAAFRSGPARVGVVGLGLLGLFITWAGAQVT